MREPIDSSTVETGLLTSASPWQAVDVYASIDSTNLEAVRDPRPWRVVVADHQAAGRGRLARQWQAPPGTSIAVSAVVPMPLQRSADWGWLPLLTGMAMRAALEEVAQVAGRLKWPNDVLVQEGLVHEGTRDLADGGGSDLPWLKICGVLCETVPGGCVVLGAGANIAQERSELPVDTATSLTLCGAGNIRREEVILAYLANLAELHRSWSCGGAELAALRTAYRSWCLTVGMEVDLHRPDGGVAQGMATGVDDTGRLVVEADGSTSAHAAGDVVHVRRSQPAGGHTA